MKDRRSPKQVTPPPFVKVAIPKPEPTLKVIHTVRESLPLETISTIESWSLEAKRSMLEDYNAFVFTLHHDLARAVAMQDALNLAINTELEKPHWVRHAAVANLHGEGPRMLPCRKCGKPTEWSFDGNPQCTFKGVKAPSTAAHAMCYVESGFKRNVTIHERDLANILSIYGTEKKGKK